MDGMSLERLVLRQPGYCPFLTVIPAGACPWPRWQERLSRERPAALLADGWSVAGLSADFAGPTGTRRAAEEGKRKLTKTPWSLDQGRGNFGRLPLRSAVEGMSREARKRGALPHSSLDFFRVPRLSCCPVWLPWHPIPRPPQ